MNPADIKAWDGNPRLHNIEALKRSIEVFGFRSVVVVNKATGQCEAGHGRVQAAIELGLTAIPVMMVNDDSPTAAAFAVGDNRQSELSWWDEDMLADILRGLEGDTSDLLGAIGYSDYELETLLLSLDPESDQGENLTQPDPLVMLERFQNAAVKQIVLILEAAEFDALVASFDRVREAEGLESNTEVVKMLVRRYEEHNGLPA